MLTLKSRRPGSPNARSSCSSTISAGSSAAIVSCSGAPSLERLAQRGRAARARSARAAGGAGRRRAARRAARRVRRGARAGSGDTNGMSQPQTSTGAAVRAARARSTMPTQRDARARPARARPATRSRRQRRVALRDHDRLDPRGREGVERMLEQRPAAELDRRLRRAQPRAAAAGEHAPTDVTVHLVPRAEYYCR